MNTKFEIYTGRGNGQLPDFSEDEKLNAPSLYRPSEALKNAVNVAISLGKPLLMTGEPGSGKTQLAYSIAADLGLAAPLVFNTRTTSVATDLFYKYNAIAHFQYSQNRQNNLLTDDEVEMRFIHYQALGQAIMSRKRQVVLIDEIDKAPRDLPNDILNILEEMAFEVPEVNKSYRAQASKKPILVLTSNSEKNLPDAFLRRCVFFHIQFPSETDLLQILSAKLSTSLYDIEALKTAVIPHFMEVRETVQRKKPGTAELLYWVSLLDKIGFGPDKLKSYKVIPPAEKGTLMTSYHVLAKNENDLVLLEEMIGYKR